MTFETMHKKDLRTSAALAAESFYDYDYFSIWFPDEKRRKGFLDALVRCEFRANSRLDSVRFVTAKEDGKILAVAQLCAPDFKKPDDLTYVLSGWVGAQFRGGTDAVKEWQKVEEAASAPCHGLKGKNWYLSLLSVATGERGKGIGSRFLREDIIPYVKGNGAESLSLFTNSEENRKFYQRFSKKTPASIGGR